MEGDGEGWTTSGNVQGLPLVLCSGFFLGDDQGALCSARDRTRIGHIARPAPKPLCYLSPMWTCPFENIVLATGCVRDQSGEPICPLQTNCWLSGCGGSAYGFVLLPLGLGEGWAVSRQALPLSQGALAAQPPKAVASTGVQHVPSHFPVCFPTAGWVSFSIHPSL